MPGGGIDPDSRAREPKLLASYTTLAGAIDPLKGRLVSPWSLGDRIAAAAAAGYSGFGFGNVDLAYWLPREGGFPGLRSILGDHGMQCVEVEVLGDWFTDGDRRTASDRARYDILEAAAELGADHVKAIGDMEGGDWPFDRMVESFSRLCQDAATAGTRICVELFPTANLRDIATGNALMAAVNAENGGLLVDIWHLTRSGGSYKEIGTIPPRSLIHVELNDADAVQLGSIMEDTILRRRMPGEGDFDIPGFLHEIAMIGYDGWYGVELLSDELRALPLDEAARRSFGSTAGFFAQPAKGGTDWQGGAKADVGGAGWTRNVGEEM